MTQSASKKPKRIGRPSVQDTRRSYVEDQYSTWVRVNRLRTREMARQRDEAQSFEYKPRVSILMTVRDPEPRLLERALDSVLRQTYGEWELRVYDRGPGSGHASGILARYEKLDERIEVEHLETGNVCQAANHALSRAGGEYVGLLGGEDELAPDALYEMVKLLQDHRDADLIYADEDRITAAGNRREPHFKPDWSPDLLMSFDYISHPSIYRRQLLEEVGGFREGFEGWHAYDLALRFTERTENIHHVPRLLYHRRDTAGEDGGTSMEGARGALSEALERRGLDGAVEEGAVAGTLRVRLEIADEPKVSVIVPTRNNHATLKNCVESIERRTTYPNYEILVVDNESDDPETVEYLASLPHRVIEFREAFNYSKINNFAVTHATGDYVLLLNDDTEVISGGWMEEMLQHAQRPEVGAVGAKLLYPDGRIQHAGVVVGVGNPWGPSVATHAHQHYPADAPGHAGAINTVRNFSAVTAACMMVRRAVFEEVGGLNEEDLRISFNDVDLCLKIRECGYLNVYTPHAELYHYESASRGYESNPLENLYMMKNWGETLEEDPYYNPNFSSGSADFNLRSDSLRPEVLLPESEERRSYVEDGKQHPLLMEPEERREYMEVRRRNARNSHKTSLAPTVAWNRFESSLSNGHRPKRQQAARPGKTEFREDQKVNFFVLGQPKSGTTWVRSTLHSHPEIACLGEGKFFGRDFKTGNPSSGGKLASMYSLFADSDDLKIWANTVGPWSKSAAEPFEQSFDRHVKGLTKAAVDYFFEDARRRLGKPIVGDKTPAHTGYLDEIHEFYPDSRIIHVIRDGRDQAVSSVFHWWKESEKAPFSNLPREILDKRETYYKDKENYGAHGHSIFEESYLRGLARSWKEIVAGAMESGPNMFGERYLEVRYEDILEDPEGRFTQMMQLLGARTEKTVVERCVQRNSFEQQTKNRKRGTEDSTSFFRKGIAGDWKNYFTGRDRQVFKEEAGDLLIRLGYETDYDW